MEPAVRLRRVVRCLGAPRFAALIRSGDCVAFRGCGARLLHAGPDRRGAQSEGLASKGDSSSDESGTVPLDGKRPGSDDKIDRRVWPIAASSLLMGSAIGVVFPIMPIFAQSIGLSTAEYGSVISVMGVTRLLFNIPAAWAAERFGRRPLLAGAPLLSSLGMALTGTAASLSELLSYRFMTGAGGSFQMAAAQLYLSDISTPANRARTMAPLMIAFSAGATVGPAVGGVMADSLGLRAPFALVGGALALVAMNNWAMVPETRPPPTGEPRALRAEFSRVASQWGPLMRNPDMQAVLTMHTSYWLVASGSVWTLLPLLASERFDFSASALGGLFATMSIINVVGTQPSAWVADKFGRKALAVPASAILATSVALMPHAASYEQFVGLVVMWSVGATTLGATPTAYVADITTEETRSQALAMLRSAGDVGLMLGAGALGTLAYASSMEVAMGASGASGSHEPSRLRAAQHHDHRRARARVCVHPGLVVRGGCSVCAPRQGEHQEMIVAGVNRAARAGGGSRGLVARDSRPAP